MKRLASAVIVCTAALLVDQAAHAALISSTAIGGGAIDYQAVQSGAQYLQAGDFVTLYDAGATPINLTGALGDSSLFQITTNLTDAPAPGIILTFADDPTIANLRFTYIGNTPFTASLLGTFSLSDPSGLFRLVSVDGHGSIPAGGQSEGSIDVAPLVATTVPEPASLSLTGLALVVLMMRRRSARRRG